MIKDFSEMSLREMRSHLLESKELLRYLNDTFCMDAITGKKLYLDGSRKLSSAASFVDDLILLTEDCAAGVEDGFEDDPDEIVPDPRFSLLREDLRDFVDASLSL